MSDALRLDKRKARVAARGAADDAGHQRPHRELTDGAAEILFCALARPCSLGLRGLRELEPTPLCYVAVEQARSSG